MRNFQPRRPHVGCPLVLALLLPACNGDYSPGKVHADLVAHITSPEDGDELADGATVHFAGEVKDDADLRMSNELSSRWTQAANAGAAEETMCNEGQANPGSDTASSSSGESVCTAVVTLPYIRLYVAGREDLGDVGTFDDITVSIVPPGVPSVTISSPTVDGVYYSDQLITFTATASDPEDAPEALSIQWTSSLDGDVGGVTAPDSSGISSSFEHLSEGEQAITVEATDSDGFTGHDSVIIDVGPPNTAPTCEITSPDDGDASAIGTTVDFRATVADVDVPEDWLSVTWSSDIDGTLRTSSPDSAGNVAFSYADLSPGSHVISLVVEDEVGGTCSDYIQYDVGSPPSVEIITPTDGSVSTVGSALRFDAMVLDAEDPEDGLALDWESSIDGTLSTAPADSGGRATFSTSTLSIGEHAVTLTATDSDGLYTRAVVTITVADCADLWYADVDGDGYGDSRTHVAGCSAPVGYVSDATDCDDALPSVFPGATEYCNGVDDDCDGDIDEGAPSDATQWYLDADGDHYGDASISTWACVDPAGYTADDTDCDDGAAAVNPGESEIPADGVDEDCDGSEACWEDGDLDSYGSGTGRTSVDLDCSDALESPVATDCDDADPDAFPGATETVADSVDQDCDGGDLCQADSDGDGFGGAGTSPSADIDCSDSGESTVISDCDDVRASIHPGATEVCDGVDNDCDGVIDEGDAADASTWYADADHDGYGDPDARTIACAAPTGYVSTSTDCNDAASSVHPGATEVCDGVDDDCDGAIDEEGGSTWYPDADADGYGTSSSPTVSCSAPSGYVSVSTDCNDAVPSVHPGATETCNSVDDNCDGAIDNGVGSTWYRDADSDSYGTVSTTTTSCTAPSGYVSVSTDCDDSSATVHPDAAETCNGIDDDCDGSVDDGVGSTWYRDADSDGYGTSATTTVSCSAPSGYVATSTDCNDAVSSIHPGATETCNSVDDNCDGAIDNGAGTTWYLDADADGYGTTTPTTISCTAPSGYSAVSTDCNDSSATTHPGATETCNGIDDDCDGSVDEGIGSTWYRDADTDGYGTSSTTTLSCTAPSGYVSTSTDCNDSSATIHPGATETCNGVDDNCDGTADNGAGSTWYRDADSDTYGTSTSTITACSAPSGYVSNSTDCNDSSASVHPGGTEVCNSIDDDCDGSVDEGIGTTWYRDADSDGYGTTSTTTTACSAPSGYVSTSTDCNDSSSSVHPGATETCNGSDDDCDGVSDDGLTFRTYYRDSDGDGYGVSSPTSYACSTPSGYSSYSTDCNDSNSSLHPGATESCDDVDNDCTGIIDDNNSCWVYVYRFLDPVSGAHCWNTSTSAPSGCTGYNYELEAWVGRTTSRSNTWHAVQCTKGTDHIIVERSSADYTALISAGYDCSVDLQYIYDYGGAPSGSFATGVACSLYRFSGTTHTGTGEHLFTRGGDSTSAYTCETPARGTVMTTFTCFSSPPC